METNGNILKLMLEMSMENWKSPLQNNTDPLKNNEREPEKDANPFLKKNYAAAYFRFLTRSYRYKQQLLF